jgi:hypothetical protein
LHQNLLEFTIGPNWEALRYIRGISLQNSNVATAKILFTGFQAVTLQPTFQVGPFEIAGIYTVADDSFQISGQGEKTVRDTMDASTAPFQPGGSFLATTPNIFACWIGLAAAVSANGGGAGVELDSSIFFDGFNVVVP